MAAIFKLAKQFKPPNRIPLDNAGQFFPGVSTPGDTWVFRLTCKLTEAVDPWALQYATEDALKHYPLYQCVLRKGFFWYFLEGSKRKPIVREDRNSPCHTIYNQRRKCLQFRVSYHEGYIHLEVYHALADGIGALGFLKLLVASYLVRKHPDCGLDTASLKDGLTPKCTHEDSFQAYYSGVPMVDALKELNDVQRGRSWQKRGYQLEGKRVAQRKIKQIAGVADTSSILAKAHEYGVSVTVFLTAILMLAIQRTTPQKSKGKPIVVNIPVNLRKYFPSKSARNFFQAVNVGHYFNKDTETFSEVISDIGEQLARELTPEMLTTRMNALCALECNPFLGIIPRFGKDVALRIAGKVGAIHTTSISNLGQITLPQELKQYIRFFDFTTSTRGLQLNVCSYENQIVMNFSSQLEGAIIQAEFFKILLELGIATRSTTGQCTNGTVRRCSHEYRKMDILPCLPKQNTHSG